MAGKLLIEKLLCRISTAEQFCALCLELLCAEHSVTSIAKTWYNVALFVNSLIHASTLNVNIRMCGFQCFLPLWAAKNTEEFDILDPHIL